jgi:hypothetical protein
MPQQQRPTCAFALAGVVTNKSKALYFIGQKPNENGGTGGSGKFVILRAARAELKRQPA